MANICSGQQQIDIILTGMVRTITKVRKKAIKCLGTSIFFLCWHTVCIEIYTTHCWVIIGGFGSHILRSSHMLKSVIDFVATSADIYTNVLTNAVIQQSATIRRPYQQLFRFKEVQRKTRLSNLWNVIHKEEKAILEHTISLHTRKTTVTLRI